MNNSSEKENRQSGLMIYGLHPVIEAVEAGKEIERIYFSRGNTSEQVKQLKKLLRDNGITWQEVPVEKLNRLTKKNHQDVVCYLSAVSYAPIAEIVQSAFNEGKNPLILILDRITDVRNFGAIARTAECSGVNAIVIPENGAAQVNADAVKTSAGALNIIPLCREKNLRQTIAYLKESGLKIFAATEKATTLSFAVDFTTPSAIIMGSEENGIAADLLNLADEKIKIPLSGSIGSLNVSVACGMILHEVIRQRTLSV